MAEGMVNRRPNPVCSSTEHFEITYQSSQTLSQRELHMLHAEIKALQETLGISYKDATHRLFMAEVERLKKADAAAKSFASIRTQMDNLVMEDICPPISAIDKGEFDEYVLKDGRWQKKMEEITK